MQRDTGNREFLNEIEHKEGQRFIVRDGMFLGGIL